MKGTTLDLRTGIDSLTNFKRRTATFLGRLRKTGQPLVLTVNGKAEVVVQDAGSYQKLLEVAEQFEAINKIGNGLKEKEQGLGRPAEEVLETIRQKHAIRGE
jgi:prevent-host-death family protein